MHTPASSKPFRTLFVGLQTEPIGARVFVILNILQKINDNNNKSQIEIQTYKLEVFRCFVVVLAHSLWSALDTLPWAAAPIALYRVVQPLFVTMECHSVFSVCLHQPYFHRHCCFINRQTWQRNCNWNLIWRIGKKEHFALKTNGISIEIEISCLLFVFVFV